MYFWGNVPPGLGDLMQTNPNGDSCDVFYNMYLDPLFVDINNDDLHLTENSPCIDAGDPDSPYDPDSTVADMGRFYYAQPQGIDDNFGALPNRISLLPNYPNPFNASTLIRYELPQSSQVKIEIYDLLGRKVTTLYDGEKQAGHHYVIWNTGDFSSGIYFYKLRAGEYSESRKMMLLK